MGCSSSSNAKTRRKGGKQPAREAKPSSAELVPAPAKPTAAEPVPASAKQAAAEPVPAPVKLAAAEKATAPATAPCGEPAAEPAPASSAVPSAATTPALQACASLDPDVTHTCGYADMTNTNSAIKSLAGGSCALPTVGWRNKDGRVVTGMCVIPAVNCAAAAVPAIEVEEHEAGPTEAEVPSAKSKLEALPSAGTRVACITTFAAVPAPVTTVTSLSTTPAKHPAGTAMTMKAYAQSQSLSAEELKKIFPLGAPVALHPYRSLQQPYKVIHPTVMSTPSANAPGL